MVNSHGNVVIPIPGEIMAVDTKRRVVSAEGVYDYNLAKDLETINSEVQANIQNLQNLIDTAGEGGTTNYSELINKPKINNIELEGNVTLEIPDSYTKTESDAKYLTEHQNIDGKANKTDVYTKEEVENLISLGGNFNPDLYYTKTDIDEKGYLTLHQNIDGKANVGDSYTKTQSDNKYALKTDLNGKADRSSLENYVLRTELPEGIVVDSFISRTSTNPVLNNVIYNALQNKQDALVSGTNIKALRSNNAQDQSLVGNGFINFKTINGNSIFGTEDIKVSAGESVGENNIIENITVNGDSVPVSETKTAEITISIPTALSELSSDENHNTVSETLITGWNNKVSGNELKTINGQSILINGNDTNLVVNPANDSNLVHKTGTESITGAKTFSEIISVGLEHTNTLARSYNSVWTTNGSNRDLSDILRVYYYNGEELKTDQWGGTVNYTRLLTDSEIYNTLITDENNLVYYAEYVDPELDYVRFRSINDHFLLTITKDLSVSEGYTILRTEIENTSEGSSYSEVVNTKYLTITSIEDDNIIYFSSTSLSTNELKTIEYSIDDGKTWNSVTANIVTGIERSYSDEYGDHSWVEFSTTELPLEICTLNSEEKVLLRGNNTNYKRHHFLSNKKFNLSGNIMSLCYSETFATNSILPSSNVFDGLFQSCVNLLHAKDLILPSQTLTEYCYARMFKDCSKLNSAPKLLASILSKGCYQEMFKGCTNLQGISGLPAVELADSCYSSMFKESGLIVAPNLPATVLTYRCYANMFAGTLLRSIPTLPTTPADSSYYGMFKDCLYLNIEEGRNIIINGTNSSCCEEMFMGCVSLTRTPKLPATRIGEKAYYKMFEGCTSLATAPELPATVLLPQSGHTFGFNYAYMFKDCISLTKAPELPATELTVGCYMSMFENCTNLTDVPTLPAIEFTESYSHTQDLDWCYKKMFKNCINLLTAPILPALILTQGCYQEMFFGCSKLNYIKCLATDISATDCTTDWVAGSTTVINLNAASSFSSLEEFEEVLEGLPYAYGTNVQYIYTLTQTNNSPGVEIGGGFNPYDIRTWPEEYKSRPLNPDYNYNYYGFVLPGWYAYYKISHWDTSVYPPTLVSEDIYTHMPQLNADEGYNYLWVSKREYNENASIIGENGETTSTGGWGEYQTPVLLKYLNTKNIGVASEGTFVKGKTEDWITDSPNGIPTNWTEEMDYSLNYLTLDILTGGNITWTTTGGNKEISYSTNNGSTWTSINSTTSIPVSIGDKLLLKGGNTEYWSDITVYNRIGTSNNATFNLYGNIMSLVHDDDFIGKNTLDDGRVDIEGNHGWPNIFRELFLGCSGLRDASNLHLPATTLSVCCYRGMFMSSGITKAPKVLPAKKLTNNCYQAMFDNCHSLTTVPNMLATELAEYCYLQMFSGCSSLIETSSEPIMELPVTKLKSACYASMFEGTSITVSPVLPATELVSNCYQFMFNSCENLVLITCYAYDISAQFCTEEWVDGVASSGTFIKSSSANWTEGVNGIPEGWTVSDDSSARAKPNTSPWYDEDTGLYVYPTIRYDLGNDNYYRKFLTFEILSDGIINWKSDYSSNIKTIYYNNYREDYWHEITSSLDGVLIEVKTGDIIIFKGNNTSYEYNHFDTSVQFNVYGNITSLLYGDTSLVYRAGESKILDNISYASVFKGLFKNCYGLISAENLILYPRTLTESCYADMFKNCISLRKSPELLATTLANNCYLGMFENCINLKAVTTLPATTLYQDCYNRMFYGCAQLNTIKCLATTFATNATKDWLEGTASSGIFIKDPSTIWQRGTSGIPEGWTVQ